MIRKGWVRLALGALLGLVVVAFAAPASAQLRVAARREGVTITGLDLVAERVAIAIDRQHAQSRITHEYRNRTGAVVEGQFQLRAGDGANVSSFAYWNGSQKIVGEVLERQAAKAIYESTTTQRRDPGLLEKSAEGSFSFRVFPIQPDERKRVEVTVDQWLERRDRVAELRMMLVEDDAEIEITIVDDRPIRNVRSPSHQLEIEGQGSKEVTLRAGPRRADRTSRELVLQYELGDAPFQPIAWVHRDSEQNGYFVLTLAAPRAAAKLSQDLTLVVDGSDTEAGQLARGAAAVLIERARGSDRLNVVVASDGLGPRRLSDRPRWVNDEVRAEGLALLREASGARVDVASALKKSFSLQEGTGRNRTIVLLSGSVPSGRDLLATLREGDDPRRGTRVFTVGFGGHIDRAAFSVLAAETRGRFLLVESRDALRPKVDRLAQQIAAPVLVDLELEVDGAEIAQVYPTHLPDLYQEQEIRVSGRIRGQGKARLAVRGRADKEVRLIASVDLAESIRHPFVAKLWGRERIAHLLEDIALFGESPERRDETIELALAYGVVTPYTAFLAIPESELTDQTRAMLGSLRAQKQALLARHPDAEVALADGPSGSAAGAAPSDSDARAPLPAAAMAPPEAEARGGCAGCTVGGPRDASHVGALMLAALAALRRLVRGRAS